MSVFLKSMGQKIKEYCIVPFKSLIKSISISNYSYLIYAFIAIIYIIACYTVHGAYGDFYLGCIDPEYFHMFNGVVIGGGNLAVEYIAHPGTPVEYLMAITARIVHFFQLDESYINGFLSNPESFIHASTIFQNIIIAVTLFLGAKYTYKKSNSFFLGLLFLLLPFGSANLFELSGRVIPESLMIWPFLLIELMVIKYLFNDNNTGNIKRDFVVWGIIFGFGIACKLSFAPVFLLPLIVIKSGWKDKITYLIFSVLAVMIFAYPIVFNFAQFKDWVFGMFTHSGRHGTGINNFIDQSAIGPNFNLIFTNDKGLFYFMAVSLCLSSLVLFKSVFKKPELVKKIGRSIVGVNATLILSIAFTVKHFALHYFMPFYIFKFFLLVLSYLLLCNLNIIKNYRRLKLVLMLLVLSIIIPVIIKQKVKNAEVVERLETRYAQRKQSQSKIFNIFPKDAPLILSAPYYGAPFQEHAINEGFMMTYKFKDYFSSALLEKYPNRFTYVDWAEEFYHWGTYVPFDKVLSRFNDTAYVYIGENKSHTLVEIEDRIYKTAKKENVLKEIIYSDNDTGELLLRYCLVDPEQN